MRCPGLVSLALCSLAWAQQDSTADRLQRATKNTARVKITFSLDRSRYLPDEFGTLRITVRNDTGEALEVPAPSDRRSFFARLYERGGAEARAYGLEWGAVAPDHGATPSPDFRVILLQPGEEAAHSFESAPYGGRDTWGDWFWIPSHRGEFRFNVSYGKKGGGVAFVVSEPLAIRSLTQVSPRLPDRPRERVWAFLACLEPDRWELFTAIGENLPELSDEDPPGFTIRNLRQIRRHGPADPETKLKLELLYSGELALTRIDKLGNQTAERYGFDQRLGARKITP